MTYMCEKHASVYIFSNEPVLIHQSNCGHLIHQETLELFQLRDS